MADHEQTYVVTTKHVSLHDNCDKACCNGFDRMQYVNTADIPQVQYTKFLALQVCPHFDYQKIKRRLYKYNHGKVPADMEVPMQLMTLMIESSLDLFFQIIFGDIRTEQLEGIPIEKVRRILFNKPTPLTEADKDKTRRALAELTKDMMIDVGKLPGVGCGGETVLKRVRSGSHAGERMVRIRLESIAEHPDDFAYTIWRNFSLAEVAGHEYTHAAVLSRYGKDGQRIEAYFGDEVVSEEGFTFEQHTLGGTLVLASDKLDDLPRYYNGSAQIPSRLNRMMLEEWPDQDRVNDYIGQDAAIGVRGPIDRVHMRWATSLGHLCKLLTAEFWANEFAVRGVAAVRFPKQHGVRMLQIDGKNFYMLLNNRKYGVTQEEDERTIPKGYHANQGGLIMPVTEQSPEIFSLFHGTYRQPPAADILDPIFAAKTPSERRKRYAITGPLN